MNRYSDEFYLSILEGIFLRIEKLEKVNNGSHVTDNDGYICNKINNKVEENKIGLSFYEALKLIKQGKLVKRLNWRNLHLGLINGSNEVAKIDSFSMCIIKILKLDDYEANDWEIIE